MVSATSAPTLDKSAVKGKYAYALMPTIPPGATSLPAGGKAAASILSGDNIVVADYSQEQGPGLRSSSRCSPSRTSRRDYYKTFGNLPANAAGGGRTCKSDPKLAAVARRVGQVRRHPVHRRVG